MPCYQSSSLPGGVLPGGVTTTGRTSYTTEADCLNACKEGACCEGTVCAVKPACQCQGAGKVFRGAGTTCSPNPCEYCCTLNPLPGTIQFTISNFTTSRGNFVNWNPNRSYALLTPDFGINASAEPTGFPASRSCVCYSAHRSVLGLERLSDEDLFGCAMYRKFFRTDWTLEYLVSIGASNGNPFCSNGETTVFRRATGRSEVTIQVWLQDKTADGVFSVVQLTDVFAVGAPGGTLSTGLRRQEFIDAVCNGSLLVNGSVATAFSRRVGSGFNSFCSADSGSVSFDWELRSNPLP